MSTSNRYAFGDFVLERSHYRVLRADGTALALTPRLFNALLLFVERAGELLDKDLLMRSLWPGLVVEENNLSQVVSALRRALGDDNAGGRFIRTVPRRGFVFVCPVTPLHEPAQPIALAVPTRPGPPAAPAAAAVLPDDARPLPLGDGPHASPIGAAQPGRRRWLRAATAASAMGATAGIAWWWAGRRDRPGADGALRLAVLPFKPLHLDSRDELLEIGMADSLVARLSTLPGLTVRSTGSVLRYAGSAQDPMDAARALDVDWIVDGSLQRHGDSLRVSARLLRAADGTAAWSGSFDEQVLSLFGVQDQISTKVMLALAPALQATAIALLNDLGGTRSPEAYQLYLAAAWRAQGTSGNSTAKAIALLHQALEIDPAYAQAWAMLAWVHRRRLWRNDAVPAQVFASSNAALQHALALTPRLAQARAGLAFSHYWHDYDWRAAEREFRAAVAANPNEVSAQWGLAQMLLTQGRIDAGFVHMRMARELDPLSPVINTMEASFLMAKGQLDAAQARLDRAFDIAPEHGLALETLGLLRLAQGQPDQGIGALRRSVDMSSGTTRPKAVLAVQLAGHGQSDEARAILLQLLARAKGQYLPGTHLAMVHAALGETAPALDALDRAYVDRDPRLIYLKDDPSWAPLRNEARFATLMKKLNLDQFGPGLAPV